MSCVPNRAVSVGLMGCHICGQVVRAESIASHRCPRCNSRIRFRKDNSIQRTWALLLTAMLLYVPANTLPVMKTAYFGGTSSDTIMSGVVYFLHHGDWPLALIIFIASVIIPLLKMLALGYLLISVQRGSVIHLHERTRLYRMTEFIGRWSMVDVFVVAILTALVHMGALATITPGWGATAFAGVVILTMLAARTFDPRLIWDHQKQMLQNSVNSNAMLPEEG